MAKAGRKRKEGIKREPSGRPSRKSIEAIEMELNVEIATWRRRRMAEQDGITITPDEARKQEYGSVIHQWKHLSDQHVEKWPDRENPMLFTKYNLATAEMIQRAYEDYRKSIGARRERSATDFSGPGGYDGTDPFDSDRESRDRKAEQRWLDIRSAVLNSGPFCMMALEGIVLENKPMIDFIGDLRLALNAVERLGKTRKVA